MPGPGMNGGETAAGGLPCPECGAHIEVSVQALIAHRPLICPGCGLRLTLEEEGSRAAIAALEQWYVRMGRAQAFDDAP